MSGGATLISGGKNHANRGVGDANREANHPANQVSNPMEGLLANPFTPKAKPGANPTSNHANRANHANLHPNIMANQGSNLMKGVLPDPVSHANLQTISNQNEPRNSTPCQFMAYSHPISSSSFMKNRNISVSHPPAPGHGNHAQKYMCRGVESWGGGIHSQNELMARNSCLSSQRPPLPPSMVDVNQHPWVGMWRGWRQKIRQTAQLHSKCSKICQIVPPSPPIMVDFATQPCGMGLENGT